MCTFAPGEMAEWSIAAVLKTVDLQGSGGSNPSLSAKRKKLAERLAFFIDREACLCACSTYPLNYLKHLN